MTETLYKIGVLSGLVTLLIATLNAMPDAQDLPPTLINGVMWFFEKMYFFNPIFDVPTFFEVMYNALIAFAIYMTLLMVRWVVLLVLRTV